MTDAEFETHYAVEYSSLLSYALHVTRDFFAAEEGVAQALIEDWKASKMSPHALLMSRVYYRVLDCIRAKSKILGYVRIDGELVPPVSIDKPNEDGLPYEFASTERSAEDVALDVLQLKEELEKNEILWDQLLDTDLSASNWHGTLTGYDFYGCRCSSCKAVKSAYMRRRSKPPRSDKETHCVNGHEYQLGSYSIKPSGSKRCNLCRRVNLPLDR